MPDATESRRISWTDTVIAVCAVSGLIITIIAGGFTLISKLDGIDQKLDFIKQGDALQNTQLSDHEQRLRALETVWRKENGR